MRVVIAEVHKNIFDGEADSLSVTTVDGVVTILPKHEPLVSTLKEGEAVVCIGDEEKKFSIKGGVLEVSDNQATIIL